MSTTEEWGKFTSVVAPVLIAFTMPTVALIATSKDWPPPYYDDSWRVATLSLFIAASGFFLAGVQLIDGYLIPVSYTHLRAHETPEHLVCRLLLEKKKKK